MLSLSATPIPRTLQMSLAGLRDISVIETPPEGRRPVKTYVGEYDEELVASAIKRELARKGQAFFLHNRVDTIDETAERIRAMVPEARVSVAHGQMAEGQLEEHDARVPARRRGRARLHLDRRVRARHPHRQHADRRARRPVRPRPALPDPGPRRALARARLRLPALPQPRRAERGGQQAAGDALRLHRAGLRLQDRHARPRDPRRRATCSARSSRATWRRSASSSTWGCSTRRCGCWPARPPTRRPSRCGWTCRGRLRAGRLRALRGRPRSRSTGAWPARARWPS